jgi:ABC-2 type transport system ATP-binding protein
MMLGIEVEGLRLRYGDTIALDDLTFALDGGKIYGLLGRNGSGKTSLLSVFGAFRKASAGTVLIGGEPVFENPRVTRQVCLIRESGDVGEKSDSIADALRVARQLRQGWDGDYAAKLLERFGLTPRQKLGQLSRGKRSALGIIFGLASRAPLTMFDESHLGMDAPSRQAFQEALLEDFVAHPRTIIVSTHLIEELGALFEEVVIIDEGKLVLHEETDALRARGTAVTGPAELVDRFAAGRTVLDTRQLGRTKSAMVYGSFDAEECQRAREAGLDLGPIALQELFVHLTEPSGGRR